MLTEWLTILRDIGNAIYELFVMPGDFVLSWFVVQAPVVASGLGIDSDHSAFMMRAVLSLLIWCLLAVAVWKLVRLWQYIARIISAAIRTVFFRISQAMRGLKTRLVCKFRQLVPRRRSSSANAFSEVDLNDLDLAVLRYAVVRGPGFAISAPELAEQFTLRPAQVIRSLVKLQNNKMLDYVIGSTDGFDNYRLTKSGAVFMAMWQQPRA